MMLKKNLLFFCFLVIFGSTINAQLVNIEMPFVQNQSDLNLIIRNVKLGDTTTVELAIINMFANGDGLKYWINPKDSPKAFYLEDFTTKKVYKFLGQKDNCTKSSPCRVKPDNFQIATLYFEKIPKSTHQLNLIEGAKDNSWDFVGIDLRRSFEQITERIEEKKCYADITFEMPINFLLSEYYKVRYYGKVIDPNPDNKGKILVEVNAVEIIDPSFVSINYIEYKKTVLNKATKSVGYKELFNEQDTKIILFE